MRAIDQTPLFLGHAGNVRNLSSLHAAGIEIVVDLAAEESPAVLSRDLVYCRFPLLDGGDNPDWLLRLAVETVADAIRNNVPCLIGCSAGLSRTPAIAVFGLARGRSLSIEEALHRVSETGPVSISPGLWEQLRKFC
ncbi:protein-tyrosine phosphatase family protein [Planctellipticum variicoloris]|uniref:protein-tyrosine phosphatase family protein n=1 Tax=Planctellipticum variicoloris TaxID=3064265 RepID=UPI0030135120|nr:dual specificity protein phosphatase family protein [Planctomycetaceae bacterium SH412]